MASIKVRRNETYSILQGTEGDSLLDTLIQNGVYFSAACGGKGKCGKCKVQMLHGATPVTEMDKSFFDTKELSLGWRLACRSFPREDCSIYVGTGDESDFEVVARHLEGKASNLQSQESGYDIGIDIGTTTIAVDIIGKTSKQTIHTVTMINRQRAYGADVISRIQASNDGKGKELQDCIRKDLYDGIEKVIRETGISKAFVERIAIAGNTTMGHLLMGYSCEGLGVYPFTPVDISTIKSSFQELFGEMSQTTVIDENKIGADVILLPGISTYVGADIAAGMLACDFDTLEQPCLLIDLGTNGEMAIGNKDRVLVTSTAAGPAFEGGNISCGMGSVQGAICNVDIENGRSFLKTIGDKPPIGLCGTGVIETVCELVKEGVVDETGMLEEDYFEEGYEVAKTQEGEPIIFTQKDVREIQLAKAAVRAGLETLLLRYGASYADIDKVYLAGGFGYKINLEKTIGIGMLPEELKEKIKAVGNSSLGGAVTYLAQENASDRLDRILKISTEIELSGDKDFNQFYTDYMFFE